MRKGGYVYILASKAGGTLYIGVTSDLAKRDYEHKSRAVDSFVKKYNCHIMVHVEHYETIEEAILREKELKKWNRAWTLRLINQHNIEWRDLSKEWLL